MPRQNDGGPAFPIPDVYGPDGCGIAQGAPGMSLRDWFAGQALIGFVTVSLQQPGVTTSDNAAKAAARYARGAYMVADAMLAERIKES